MGGTVLANLSSGLSNKSQATATKSSKVTNYTMYKRVFIHFLQDNLKYKKDVYEASIRLMGHNLPDMYIERLKYEQEDMCSLFLHLMSKETSMFIPEEDGLYCKTLKTLINEENLHLHWQLVERCIFPESQLTWMEYIFGPVNPLFRNPELNDFLLEWHGADREAIMKLFLGHCEVWNYRWMNHYRDILAHPDHYDQICHFPNLPEKIPKCLGHISGCNKRSHHFCDDCKFHFNEDPIYAYLGDIDGEEHCHLQVPTTPDTS